MQYLNYTKQHTKSPRVSYLSFSWYNAMMPWVSWRLKIVFCICSSFNCAACYMWLQWRSKGALGAAGPGQHFQGGSTSLTNNWFLKGV